MLKSFELNLGSAPQPARGSGCGPHPRLTGSWVGLTGSRSAPAVFQFRRVAIQDDLASSVRWRDGSARLPGVAKRFPGRPGLYTPWRNHARMRAFLAFAHFAG